MNINKNIWNQAEKRGLDYINTGGGCDYIWRGVGNAKPEKEFPFGVFRESRGSEEHGVDLVLGSREDVAWCPESMEEPATVSIYINDPEWHHPTFVDFKDVKAAMDFMASVTDCWNIDHWRNVNGLQVGQSTSHPNRKEEK